MSDHQRLVDDIRSFLHSSDQTLTDTVKELASSHVSACQEVNARLRRCADFLQQGLRSEAIHLAQADPVLLDDLAVLDFPERVEWEEVSLTYGLPAPPKLNMEAAEALNEAYADALPLDGLLRQHRLLALAHASLAHRLRLMRKISALDTKSAVWAEDIQAFEKARFAQIDKEAKQAIAGNNVVQVAALADELGRTKWLAAPPGSLKSYVESAASRFHQKKLRERLENLEQKLNEAHSALDVERGRTLRAQWQELCREIDLPIEDSLRDRVFPALGWLQKEDRKEATAQKQQAQCAELESALNDSAPSEVLESRYAAVKALAGPLPSATEERYHKLIQSQIVAQRWRMIRIAGTLLAAALLLIGILVFWTYQANQARRASESAQQLKSLLEADRLLEARDFLDRLTAAEPRVARRPELVDLQKRLIDREAKDEQRAALFQQALKEAKGAIEENPEAPALAQAQNLSRLPEEQAAVRQLSALAKEFAWRKQKTRNELFLPRLNDTRRKLKELEDAVAAGFDRPGVADLDREVAKILDDLKLEAKAAGAQQREWADELINKLGALRASVDRQGQEKGFMQRLTTSLAMGPNLDKYMNALADYGKAFPEHGKHFERAAKERPLWDQVLARNAMIAPWLAKPFGLPPKDAKACSEKCQQFIADHRPILNADKVDDFWHCVDALSQQDEDQKDSAATKLRELFSNVVIRDLWFVELESGKTYYLKEDPEEKIAKAKKQGEKGFINVQYVCSFDGSEKGKPLKAADISKSGRAPQSEVADEFQVMFGNPAKDDWDAKILNLAKLILAKKGMDPILELTLLKAVFENGGKASYPLALALRECSAKIKKSNVDWFAPWVDPSWEGIATRRQARDFIQQLPTMELVQKASAENRKKLESSVADLNLLSFGWLAHTKSGWQCVTSESLGNGELYVALPKGKDRADCQKVGTIVNGKAKVGEENPDALLEGRLVFVRKFPPR